MGKTAGLTQYECDRCDQKEITTEGAPAAAFWHDVSRLSADGVEVRRLLCNSCYKEYVQFVSDEDAAFNRFMEEKVG